MNIINGLQKPTETTDYTDFLKAQETFQRESSLINLIDPLNCLSKLADTYISNGNLREAEHLVSHIQDINLKNYYCLQLVEKLIPLPVFDWCNPNSVIKNDPLDVRATNTELEWALAIAKRMTPNFLSYQNDALLIIAKYGNIHCVTNISIEALNLASNSVGKNHELAALALRLVWQKRFVEANEYASSITDSQEKTETFRSLIMTRYCKMPHQNNIEDELNEAVSLVYPQLISKIIGVFEKEKVSIEDLINIASYPTLEKIFESLHPVYERYFFCEDLIILILHGLEPSQNLINAAGRSKRHSPVQVTIEKAIKTRNTAHEKLDEARHIALMNYLNLPAELLRIIMDHSKLGGHPKDLVQFSVSLLAKK